MKPEPLENKEIRVASYSTDLQRCNNKQRAFFKEDVKSAIEWLKKEIRQLSLIKISNPTDEVIKKIDEAFDDLFIKNKIKELKNGNG